MARQDTIYRPIWVDPIQDEKLCQTFVDEFHVHPVTAQVLVSRKFKSTEAVHDFLYAKLPDLLDPALFPEMKMAIERLYRAREEQETILIYGDNDTFSPGLARNISPHGILIQAEYQLFPINRKVKVILSIDSEPVSLNGVVCWNSEYTTMEDMMEKQLGLFIPDPPLQYVDYVNRLQ